MLSREQFEELGGAFVHEGTVYDSDPDQPVYAADLTIDGHTEHFQGKSEEDVLATAAVVLKARGVVA